jgi:3-carboxy-cis,cis-muconate cycloisomerase
MGSTTAVLGKLGEDLILLTQSGIGQVQIAGAGASSTMPQKQNPVGPSVLVALARQVGALAGVLQDAGLHRQQRDGAAWFAEWLSLPQACILTSRALGLAQDLAGRITPNAVTMARNLTAGGGLIHAEALSFALATRMPRPEAQAVVKRLCREVEATGTALPDLAMRDYPGTDWHAVLAQGGLGQAPTEARAFAAIAAITKG